MTIRRLPEMLVNQIAAGEVVERPASATKELVENSIDAGANRIDITVIDGGRSVITVSDDGHGMTPDELILSIERHATSKLPNDDLVHIQQLGFRGEALPSIGAVSRLSIISRTPEASEAWRLNIESGKISAPIPAAHQPGTRVEIRDLFYTTPARLKFLKTERTEFSRVEEVIKRLAMAHPNIGFSLSNGERRRLDLMPNQSDLAVARINRLEKIMGRDFVENALSIEAERDGFKLSGHVSLPTFNRSNASLQFLFVNGRPVSDRILFGAVRGAYRDFLASGRHPVLALFLDAPPSEVDVNVHPAKSEVRFRDSRLVRGLMVGAIKQAISSAGHRASTTLAETALGAITAHGAGAQKPNLPEALSLAHRNLVENFQSSSNQLPNMEIQPSASIPNASNTQINQTPETARLLSSDGNDFPLGVARGQLHTTYIVSQTIDGIIIVDQHAAHERLVEEEIKTAIAAGGVVRQGLLIPEVVELNENSAERLLARTKELTELGLIIETFGPDAIVVREVPALLGEMNIHGLIQDLADDFSELDEAITLKDHIGKVCATMACHGSVRAGRHLNGDEMNSLLRKMEATPHSGQCSHGRPTYVELKLHDIEKLFGRR